MGTFHVAIEIGDPAGTRWQTVQALVDTGASYTVVPSRILAALSVQPTARWPFEFPDGREVQLDVGQTPVRINGERTTTIVVFGPDDGEPLLGAYTLEGLRLAADPVRQRLIQVPGLLMRTVTAETTRTPAA